MRPIPPLLRKILEHGGVLFLYSLLTIVYTWPLVAQANEAIMGFGDARHHLWLLWHTREALLGQDGLFYTNLLFYPTGISLLTHALGPVLGIVALPFWQFGPEVANNATTFIAFALTGYAMYLLARSLGFSVPISFFAGLVLLAAPIHVAALYGHLTKVFIAPIPLAMIAAIKAVNPRGSRWWPAVTGIFLLLALLHSAEQFIYAGFGIGIVLVVTIIAAPSAERKAQLIRWLWIAAFAMAFCGPVLIAIGQASSQTGIAVDRNLESLKHQPDVMSFLVPIDFGFIARYFRGFIMPLHHLEAYVFLPWTALFLLLVALFRPSRRALPWILLACISVIFALGPRLSIAGETQFTEYELPIILPYALLTSMPGLDFMRTPGRFMLVGYVGIGIAAAYGIKALVSHSNRKTATIVPLVLAGLLLLETIPQRPRQMERLPETSPFFEQLGEEPGLYGILDLPIRPDLHDLGFTSWHMYFSSYYQMFQMAHKKGIATGYLSRYYDVHPALGFLISENVVLDSPLRPLITVNDRPGDLYADLEYELARNNYRYVALHKPQPQIPELKEDSTGLAAAEALIDTVFLGREPIYDDHLVTVYEISPPDVEELKPNIVLFEQSDYVAPPSGDIQLIESPARFLVTTPVDAYAELEISARVFQDPEYGEPFEEAIIEVTSGDGQFSSSAKVTSGDEEAGVRIPLALLAGSQNITMTVHAVTPIDRPLDMDIESINLDIVGEFAGHCSHADKPGDASCSSVGDAAGSGPVARYVEGWYEEEHDGAQTWKWAASPATMWVYSPDSGNLEFLFEPIALHDASSADGKGTKGTMNIVFNGEKIRQDSVEVGQSTTVQLKAEKGWNELNLTLTSGNFRPGDIDPTAGDYRDLSFAVKPIEVRASTASD